MHQNTNTIMNNDQQIEDQQVEDNSNNKKKIYKKYNNNNKFGSGLVPALSGVGYPTQISGNTRHNAGRVSGQQFWTKSGAGTRLEFRHP